MRLPGLLKTAITGLVIALMTGCATTVKTVPFTVQSDPLGAYVLFQVQADQNDNRSYDWIYLGTTPLNTRRTVYKKDLDNADAFILRVMKDGYLHQDKAWTGQQIVREAKSKGTVFWNPKLVPGN